VGAFFYERSTPVGLSFLGVEILIVQGIRGIKYTVAVTVSIRNAFFSLENENKELHYFDASDTHHRLYRGTSLIRITTPVGTYSSPMVRDLW